MRIRNLAVTAVVGLALAGVTMFQTTALCTATALCPGTASSDVVVASAAPPPGIAAEGRVVGYPGSEVRVAAERGGRLVRILVEEGTTVQQGDLLAELESEELLAALAEAQARVAETDVEIRLAELNQRRRKKLVAQHIVAVHDLDQANRDLEIARARRDTAQAEIARLDAQLRKTLITAPISGTVIARDVDAGETLEANDAVVTLADLTRLRIEGEADEADAASLALGSTVAINAYGYPGQSWKGRIEEVADSVTIRRLKPQDPGRPTDTRVIAVKVAFAEPSPLKLGTTVELAISPLAERAQR